MRTRLRPRTLTLVTRWLVAVWLFAVAQSVANACLVQLGHGASGPGHAQRVALDTALTHVHTAAHDAGHHEPATDAALCLKTCDGARSAAWHSNPPWLPELGPALAIKPWAAVPHRAALDPVDAVAPPGDPPLSIRFLKLNR